jgi:tetratricopeptide (TPR) repeat protein
LNVRYVLEGSVQRSGKRLRVNVQLIDAETGIHLWAERFDKPVIDLFDMQDEIVATLANTLDAELMAAEARRSERSPSPDAMDLCFQGKAWMNKGISPEVTVQARGFFERALALDPGNIEALVGVAIVDVTFGPGFLADDRAARLVSAEAAATKALSLAPNHATAHVLLGVVKIFTNQGSQGIAECERALALDRNLADAHAWIGIGKYSIGRAEETEAHIHEALRLSPRDIHAFRWMWILGLAKFQLQDDAEAAAWMRRSLEANRNQPIGHFLLAAVLAQLGMHGEALASVQAGLVFDPGFTIKRFLAGEASDNPTYLAARARLCEGLRMAGVPEG